jgi:hypothetical protein
MGAIAGRRVESFGRLLRSGNARLSVRMQDDGGHRNNEVHDEVREKHSRWDSYGDFEAPSL